MKSVVITKCRCQRVSRRADPLLANSALACCTPERLDTIALLPILRVHKCLLAGILVHFLLWDCQCYPHDCPVHVLPDILGVDVPRETIPISNGSWDQSVRNRKGKTDFTHSNQPQSHGFRRGSHNGDDDPYRVSLILRPFLEFTQVITIVSE
jgi:hypothetical protein